MRVIKCDICTELVGDFQHEVLRVGNRNYDLHIECARKLKERLKGAGDVVDFPCGVWSPPSVPYTVPYTPLTIPTPSFPYTSPQITYTNSVGEIRV